MSGARAPIPRTLAAAAAQFFRFGSPILLAAQLACALVVRAFLGPLGAADAAVLAGVALYWPLQEWAAHRWILHARPLRLFGRTFESAAARKHRTHHEDPVDLQASLLPTWTIAVLVPIHVGLWTLFAPARIACTGIVCFGGATLFYEWIHFLTHTAYRPRGRWFGEVKRRHMAHHQRDPGRWFGFMVPALDDWLRTGDR